MRIRFMLGLAAVLVLSGCATHANYERMLQGFMDMKEEDIVFRWGPPDRVYDAGGKRYIAYNRRDSWTDWGSPAMSETIIEKGRVRTVNRSGTPPITYTNVCETTFEISNGVVTRASWRGDGCVL